MITVYILAALYFVILGLFSYYGWLNVRQSKTIQDWNDSTKHEIEVIRERNLELEQKVKELVEFRKTFDATVDVMPDVKASRKEVHETCEGRK